MPQSALAPFKRAREDAAATDARILVVYDPGAAVQDAAAVYTDVWASMGKERDTEKCKTALAPCQVNSRLMALAQPDAAFMHCLPAHCGEEVTDEVLDAPHSVVIEQAENRLHAHKALLLALLGGDRR